METKSACPHSGLNVQKLRPVSMKNCNYANVVYKQNYTDLDKTKSTQAKVMPKINFF